MDGLRREDGFALTEAVVAIGLFGLVAIGMAGVMAGGLKGVMLGKQRSVATADANLLLEQARSLSFADVGLASNDPTLDSDPALITINPTTRTYNGEQILFAQNSAGHPFSPHIQNGVQRNPTTLTRAIYVTGVDTNTDGQWDVKRVTTVVSWERQAVQGVANSVTASTILSANSPGTPGNPPVGTGTCPGCPTPCPGCPTPTPPPFPPLAGFTTASSLGGIVKADIGSGADVGSESRPVAEVSLSSVNGHGDNRLEASSRVTCTQQSARFEGELGGVATASSAGTSASNTADSVTQSGPFTNTGNQADGLGGIAPAPLSISEALGSGVVSCTSSGVTSGPILPSETGTGTFNGVTIQASTAAAPLTAPLAGFSALEVSAMTANQSVTQTTPDDKMVTATATHGLSDAKIMKQTGIVTGVLNLNAPDGLVHVQAYQATAMATASSATGSQTVSTDPSKPLVVRVWDNGSPSNLTDQNGSPIMCDSHSGNYCELRPNSSSARIVKLDVSVCLKLLVVCLVEVRAQTTVTISPAKLTTTTLSDGLTRVYRADYTPVSVVASLQANNFGSAIRLVDISTDVNMGRVFACARYGLLNAGCS